MPTYEYACRECGRHTEAVQAFTDDPLTVCPSCGGPLRKVFGAIGISFKGSGFYKNDSRSSTNGTATRSDEAKADGAKADGAKADGAGSEGAKPDAAKSTSDGGSTATPAHTNGSSDTKAPSGGASKPAAAAS